MILFLLFCSKVTEKNSFAELCGVVSISAKLREIAVSYVSCFSFPWVMISELGKKGLLILHINANCSNPSF